METSELLSQSKCRLADVNRMITKWEGYKSDQHLNAVQSAFVGGLVGGSGRNNYALNQRRERNLHKTIEAAKHLVPLYDEQSKLEHLIQDIESGEYERKKLDKATSAQTRAERLAAYWTGLKAGDTVQIGFNDIVIRKKNKLSIVTDMSTWPAVDIIGKEAVQILKQAS